MTLLDDLEDMASDEEARREGKPASRFADCENCVAKADFPDTWQKVCETCELKKRIDPMTERGLALYELVEAGCVFRIDDLSLEEWRALSRVRQFVRSQSLPKADKISA